MSQLERLGLVTNGSVCKRVHDVDPFVSVNISFAGLNLYYSLLLACGAFNLGSSNVFLIGCSIQTVPLLTVDLHTSQLSSSQTITSRPCVHG